MLNGKGQMTHANGDIYHGDWLVFGGNYQKRQVITRLVLARNDLLTSFDLRAQIFRVNIEFSIYYHGQKFFSKKMSESDLLARKKKFSKFFLQRFLLDHG